MAQEAPSATRTAVMPPASADAPQTSSALFSIGGALTLIIALILAVAWLSRRSGILPPAGHRGALKVVDSKSLGSRERVVVVEVEKQWLVLGVTPGQINHLHTLDAPSGQVTPPQPVGRERFARLLRSRMTGQGSE